MSPRGGIRPHKRFTVQATRSEVLFVDYIAEHLTPTGRAAVIVPEGIIFQNGSAYKQLRKNLVDQSLVAVISLPAGVFNPYSGVKTSILIMDRRLSKKTDNILFAKIENDGFNLGAQRRPIDKNDLPAVARNVKSWLDGVRSDSPFDCEGIQNLHLVEKTRIAENGEWNLSRERYRSDRKRVTDWPMVELGDTSVFQIESGGTPKSTEESYWRGGIAWATLVDLPQEDFITSIVKTERTITEAGLANSSAKVLPEGSVIVSSRATIGRVGIARIPLATNQGFKNIVILDTMRASPEFVAYMMKRLAPEMEVMATGGTFKEISKSTLSTLLIPLPPLEVQKEIVAEIEGYQKIIDGARQVVENYQPRIPVDPDWPMPRLQEICDKITDGTHRTPNYTDSGIPFLRVTDITQSNGSKKFISYEEHAELIKRCKPEVGDVLYSKNGTIGVAKLVDWDWEFSIFVSLALLKPKRDRLDSRYLETFLNSDGALSQATARSKSGTVTNLHLEEINEMQIPLPPIETQRAIVAQIEKEQQLVNANKELIQLFEAKITAAINRVWGEEA